MDGNGRWAKKRGMPRLFGHKAGMESLRAVIKACVEFGVRYLTVYAFSTENWGRPQEEVSGLEKLFHEAFTNELLELHRQGVRIIHLGQREGIPQDLLDETGLSSLLSGYELMLAIIFPDRYKTASAISYTYLSADPQGEPVELSALLYIPDAVLNGTKALTGISLTNHGTIASNAECPTMKAQFEGALAWKNYAMVMPDYYGFGASADRPQAYLDPATTARGNIDAYLAARQLLEDRKVALPSRLYSFGYSQGGFNSMANLKYVSEHPELSISFEKVMCGGSPFDVELTWNAYTGGTFRNAIAFVPLSVVSVNEAHQLGIPYGDLFQGALLSNWKNWILSKEFTLAEINEKLGTDNLADILNEDFLSGTGDAHDRVMAVCRGYSLTSGWTPPSGTKIFLYHSNQDDTVPYGNLTAMKTFLDGVAPGCYTAYDGNNGGHINAVVSFVLNLVFEW